MQEPCALWPLDRAEPLSGCLHNCAGRLAVSEVILCRTGPSIPLRRSPAATAEGHAADADPDWVEDEEEESSEEIPSSDDERRGRRQGRRGHLAPRKRGGHRPPPPPPRTAKQRVKQLLKPSSATISQLHFGMSPSFVL